MSLGNIMSHSVPVMGIGKLSFQYFYISLSRSNFLTSYFFFFNIRNLFKGTSKGTSLPLCTFQARSPPRLLIPSQSLNGANKNTSTQAKTSKLQNF
ncbi:hypothetical protein CEXT_271671 [Caerostris extrusa]|uniref:Uncharacterized protein n=1 Tax=Caerostris extrusa TaxID=172846 RepID=A0AAV4YD26_CAEEX|nr:hypothetical protein CEXT_271671 [Caerostris extrusa]